MTESLDATANLIRDWAHELGFQAVGITDTQLEETGQRLNQWLDRGAERRSRLHGTARREALQAGTTGGRHRTDHRSAAGLPPGPGRPAVLGDDEKAYITRYSLGRDYHKLMRKRLAKLAKWIDEALPGYYHRAFVDSAPVMEKPIAVKAGLGWQGKHTLLLHPKAGSWVLPGRNLHQRPAAH